MLSMILRASPLPHGSGLAHKTSIQLLRNLYNFFGFKLLPSSHNCDSACFHLQISSTMSTRNRFSCLSPHLMQRNPWVLMTSPPECQKMHTALQGNFSVTKLFNQSLHISNSWKFTRIHLHVVQPSVYLLAPKHTVYSCLPPNVNYFCPAHPHTWIYSST